MYDVTKENLVGIGKIKFYPVSYHNYNMPVLHYLVIKEEDQTYSAICIELRIEANAKTVKLVRDLIVKTSEEYINNIFSRAPSVNEAYNFLIELSETDDSNANHWSIYRWCQLKLSQQGVVTDIILELEQEIRALKKRIVDLESAQKFPNNPSVSYSDEFLEYVA